MQKGTHLDFVFERLCICITTLLSIWEPMYVSKQLQLSIFLNECVCVSVCSPSAQVCLPHTL